MPLCLCASVLYFLVSWGWGLDAFLNMVDLISVTNGMPYTHPFPLPADAYT